MPLINMFLIEPDISQRLYVVIVKGDFEEYIKIKCAEMRTLIIFFISCLNTMRKKDKVN